MASKCTPDFNAMVAARGGRGMTNAAPGKKAPAPAKAAPKGGKMRADTDKDGY